MQKLITFTLLLTILLIPTADAAVRVVYFTPNDRPVQWTIPAALDTQMKAVQQFYADQMSEHGYGNKTFEIETGVTGKLVVHHLTGNYSDSYYHTDTLNKVHAEIQTRFDTESDVYAVFVDISTERVNGSCGIAYFEGGPAMFPVSGECVTGDAGVDLIAHELGHAFNLEHDFRADSYIMSYGHDRTQFSECAATLLNVSPYFNVNTPTTNTPATIEMLSGSTYTSETTDWTLRFSVNDADGVYQVQFLHALPNTTPGILGCQRFDNDPTVTVDFTMPDGATFNAAHHIYLRVIDANGYLQTKEWQLNTDGETVPITQNTDNTMTYLTLTHNAPDSLMPTNNKNEWAGWLSSTWERTPDSKLALRPQGFIKPEHIPYFDEWDHFFYTHAASRLVYNLSNGNYATFDAHFFLPNPCGDIASVEVIAYADDTEIYKSGELRKHNTQNININFAIPENTETLTLQITDAGDGNACDHCIFGNPRLLHADSTTTTETGIDADVNNDGSVDLFDVLIVRSAMNAETSYDTDVNDDGKTDEVDLLIVKAIAIEAIVKAAPSKRKINITTWGAMKAR